MKIYIKQVILITVASKYFYSYVYLYVLEQHERFLYTLFELHECLLLDFTGKCALGFLKIFYSNICAKCL